MATKTQKPRGQSLRQKAMIELWRRPDGATAAALAAKIGASSAPVASTLRPLIAAGVIRAEGPTRATVYTAVGCPGSR